MMILIVIVEIYSKSSTLLLDTNDSDFNNINNYAIIQVPGLFIEQYHPLQQQINESYCNFNYALPNTFQFDYNVASNGTPEQGFTSPYRVLYNVISYSNNISILRKVPQITLCTHATPEFIPHFTELLRYWNGFISLTIFVPDFDAQVTLKHLKLLCYCLPEMYRVAVHFVYPLDAPPYINPNELQSPITECKVPQVFKSYRSIHSKIYPVNVGRNVARIGAKTRFVLVSDVELIPSFGLSEKFLGMIERIAAKAKRSEVVYDSSSTLATMESDGNRDEVNRVLSSRYIFVVPVFEVELDEKVPRTKLLLQNMYAQDKAVYFHRWLCLHCQRFPGIQKWLSVVSNPDIVKVKLYSVFKIKFSFFPTVCTERAFNLVTAQSFCTNYSVRDCENYTEKNNRAIDTPSANNRTVRCPAVS